MKAPEREELERLVQQIAERVARALELRTITALAGEEPRNERVAKANGFSLHAGVSCEAHQGELRERLCRYIARPAVAEQRLTSFSNLWISSRDWPRWCRAHGSIY